MADHVFVCAIVEVVRPAVLEVNGCARCRQTDRCRTSCINRFLVGAFGTAMVIFQHRNSVA